MKKSKRSCSLLLAIMLVLTMIPFQTQAASTPKFQVTHSCVYENSKTTDWIYTLANVSNGQQIKWSLTGNGKKYASLKFTGLRHVKSNTISNAVILNTKGSKSAMNKTITIVAKIYNKKGKYVTTKKTSSTIKILSTGISLTGGAADGTTYYTGTSYSFGTNLTPRNSTDSVTWKVTDSYGNDVSSSITAAGVFTTTKAGRYVIKASSYAGAAHRYDATKEITVKDMVSGISQTGINTFKVQVLPELASKLTPDSFRITGVNGTTYSVKSVTVGNDNYVHVTTYNNFSNGITYTVAFENYTRSFTASTGLPKRIEILTTQVTVNKPTQIKYALYDQNGVDVTPYYRGTLSFQSTLPNVVITSDYKLTMSTVNTATNLTVTFIPSDSYVSRLIGSGTVVCVANETAVNSNFTITNSSSAPNYKLSNYRDNRKTTVGASAYAHFRALDKDGDAIVFDKIEYYSDKENSLIIDKNTGKITAIKNDTVTITVRAIIGNIPQYYPYTVTITDAAYLNNVELDKTYVTMSNVYNSSYVEYISLSATDQFGDPFALDNENVTFAGPSNPKMTYNKATNQIAITASGALAGDYTYTASISCGSRVIPKTFYVKVINASVNGSVSYSLEFDHSTVDTSVNRDTTTGDKYATLKLIRKVDGIFSNYVPFNVLSISKDGKYYSSNLTNTSQTNAPTYTNVSQLALLVNSIYFEKNGYYKCRPAEAGTYTIKVNYYRSDNGMLCTDDIQLTITDSDKAPIATISQTTSSSVCTTALDLARNCIMLDRGTITECSVIGANVTGSKYMIASQCQYHIPSIIVETSTQISSGAYVTKQYTLPINQTFTNK